MRSRNYVGTANAGFPVGIGIVIGFRIPSPSEEEYGGYAPHSNTPSDHRP